MSQIQWENIDPEPLKKQSKLSNKNVKIFITCLALTVFQILLLSLLQNRSFDTQTEYLMLKTRKNIKMGSVITANDIYYTKESSDSIKELLSNNNIENFIGKRASHDINENSYMFKSSVVNANKNIIPDKIPYGKRLFVLDLELGNIAKNLRNGDKIDLIANLDIPNFGKATEVILQNIQLIGIDDKNKNDNLTYHSNNSLSFYLTPEEIKIILFMKKYASFTVALRNPNDNFKDTDYAITLNKFIENEKIKKIIKNDHFRVIYGEKK